MNSWTHNVHREVFDNGLTVLVQREISAPVIAVVVHVKAGYFDEPDEWVGISHVLEHMFFKGTKKRGPGDVAKETKALGGYVNAGTIYDRTNYYVVLPSGGTAWRKAMEIQADALINCVLDPGELQRELEVIIQEASRKLDNPSAVCMERLYSSLYPNHPMGRWRIGTEKQLRRLKAPDVRAYYSSRYRPGNTILSIVGDIEVSETVSAASKLFGNWQSAPDGFVVPEVTDAAPPPSLEIIRGDVERSIATMGWRTIPECDRLAPVLDFAAAVLGAGRGGWLYRGLRIPGLVTSVSASHYTPGILGVFDVFLQGDSSRLSQAVSAALGCVERLGSVGPSESDMQRAVALLTTRRARGLESMEGRASALCHFEALGGFGLADDYWKRFNSVSSDDVREVAVRYLDPGIASAVLYLPQDAAGPGSGWPVVAAVPLLEEPPVKTLDLPVVERPPTGLLDVPQGVRGVESQGTSVAFRCKPGTGICVIGVYFPDLGLGETAEDSGLTALLARASIRGVTGFTGPALASAAESLGGSISSTVTREIMGWGLTVRASELGSAIGLLNRLASEPVFDLDEVATEREQQAADARRARDDMFAHPIRESIRSALAGSSYGLPTIGIPGVVEKFSAGQLHSLRERLASKSPLLIAAGDLPDDGAIDTMVESWNWSQGTPYRERLDVGWVSGEGFEDRDKEQTALAMAFPGIPFAHPDRPAVLVLCALLGGMGGRLFEALRERRSLAYTVAVIPWLQRHAGAVVTYIATSPDRESVAREQMLTELARLVNDGLNRKEFEGARAFLIGQEKMKIQSSESIVSRLVKYWSSGSMQHAGDLIDSLQGVSKEDVERVAGRVFRLDDRYEYVVRGGVKG